MRVAELLRFIKRHGIKNVAWLTADVHCAAAHHYDPARARFTDFNPFWEFVAGPLHAGTFGPGEMDNTFGPEVKFTGIPQGMKPNRPPSDNFQFFGSIKIDGRRKK
ncbi:MAG: alkaline phosphatase D family protein [Pyrinomonadaceae bacterium]